MRVDCGGAVTPKVGDRYISSDQAGACKALGLGYAVGPVVFVSVSHVYPDHRKVRVVDGRYWLTFDELEQFFRKAPKKDTDD